MPDSPTFHFASSGSDDESGASRRTIIILFVLICFWLAGYGAVLIHTVIQGTLTDPGAYHLALFGFCLLVAVLLYRQLSVPTSLRLTADHSGIRYEDEDDSVEFSYGEIRDIRCHGTPYIHPRLTICGPDDELIVSARWPDVDTLGHLVHRGLDDAGNVEPSFQDQLSRFYRQTYFIDRIRQKQQKLAVPGLLFGIAFWLAVFMLTGTAITTATGFLMFTTMLLPLSGMYIGEWLLFRSDRDQITPTDDSFPEPATAGWRRYMLTGYIANTAIIAVGFAGLVVVGS